MSVSIPIRYDSANMNPPSGLVLSRRGNSSINIGLDSPGRTIEISFRHLQAAIRYFEFLEEEKE